MTDEVPPKQRVSDRFRVTKQIGSGGFGTVWHAVDEQEGSDVAIKFPQAKDNESNEAAEIQSRFRNECEILAQFEGGVLPTSIVRYIDGRKQDPMHIILEYIEGTELTDRVTRSDIGPGIETAHQFGFPVIRALEFLHRNQICYLDCKPENILVRARDDSPVLIDFNTAEPISKTDTLFHEDDYKAPEQIPSDDRGSEPGPWSDVYAAGKLLCFLLTGTTMATRSTPSDGIDVREYGCDPPAGIQQIVRHATKADPAQRPQDAGELLTHLYDTCGMDTAVAALSDARTNAICPIRSGETVGRVSSDSELPDVAVADPERYVSPIHFEIARDEESWLVRDRSLNGTYIEVDGEWQRLLSSDGYEHLQREAPERAPDEQPPNAGRIRNSTTIAPVDPSYVIDLNFHPRSNRD